MYPILGSEVVISRASAGVTEWGPWQFPVFHVCRGKLFVEFHAANDSAKDYALPKKRFVSSDQGESWDETDEFCGLELPNGEIIRPHIGPSLPEEELTLPKEVGRVLNYGLERKIYEAEQVDERYTKWHLDRFSPLDGLVSTEEIKVRIPGGTVGVTEGVLPARFFWSLQLGFKGAVWAPLYKELLVGGRLSAKFHALYLKSDDNGRSFETVGRILYQPPYANDPASSDRGGFTEPSIQWLDEENGFSILRVTDGIGVGPAYISYTEDGGRGWSHPEYFDDRGVLPQSVLLGNGVVLAAYGRPGLFVRPYYEGKWFERLAVVEPAAIQTDTCSYCAIAPIDDDSALIAYSRFQYPDENGNPRKTILCRRVSLRG